MTQPALTPQAGRSARRTARKRTLAAGLLALALLPVLPASAGAAAPPQLWQTGETGSGAGQTDIPRGIAANSNNGHVFVSDQRNRRIVELNALGQFVRAWGRDVVASGPGESGSGFEICEAEDGDTCKKGIDGTGAGQFGEFGPQGLALDSAGNVYVVDFANLRVEKFDSEGHFLLMFGGEVNKTKSEEVGSTEAQRNLCTAASGDVCQVGAAGSGNGQFDWSFFDVGSFIAIDSGGTSTTADDKVHVGDRDRIQRFDAGGAYQGEISLPGKIVRSLAVDAAGNLYAGYYSKSGIHKLSPSGEPLSPSFKFPKVGVSEQEPIPTAVAVDAAGHVFAFGFTQVPGGGGSVPLDPIFEFDPSGQVVANFGIEEFVGSTGLATNLCEGSEAPGDLYVTNIDGLINTPDGPIATKAFVRAYGTAPSGCFNADTGTASNVEEEAATLNGTVNPKGTPVSECRFEYGLSATPYEQTVPCVESSGEIGTGTKPVPVHADIGGLDAGTVYHFRLRANIGGATENGSDETVKTLGPPTVSGERVSDVAYTEATLKALVNPEGLPASYRFEYGTDTSYGQSTATIAIGSDRSEHPVQASLAGLTPGTTYHWRVVATNAALFNGGLTEGPDQTFATYRQPVAETDCPNQAFRTGPSATLPDCRAYEMVSPVDKNGGDITPGVVQTANEDGKIVYAGRPAFGDAQTNVAENHYLAERDPVDGWASRGIHPPVLPQSTGSLGFGLGSEFMAFSPDLCSGWFIDMRTPPLTPAGQYGYQNIYRLDLCAPVEPPEALTDVEPPPGTRQDYVNGLNSSVGGYSADGSHALFSANAALTPEAASGGPVQIYDRFGGALHLVSILPDGSPAPGDAYLGSSRGNRIENAVSEDGSRAYWTNAPASGGSAGAVYLRLRPEQGAVEGECSEASLACTVPVSTNLSTPSNAVDAFYWGAAADGSAALYTEGGFDSADLYEFDLQRYEEGKPPRLIASGVDGVLGAAEDLSRIYFVSYEALTGAQQNSEGDEAKAGQPNLYLDEGGALTYVATLIGGDVNNGPNPKKEERAYNVVSSLAVTRTARVSPDGSHIAFQSRAPLTGFDNTDPASGEALVEVFAYEAGGELQCVSCNPSGAQPSGREVLSADNHTGVFASAWIPGGVQLA
ncbi:MAG TPA: hypothetical protein VF729_02610, partial [Solirubrobacterales bacterium]